MRLYLLLTTAISFVLAIEPHWINTNALRTIDLTKSYIKESLAVILENVSDNPQTVYCVPADESATYSFFEVREKGKRSTSALKVEHLGDVWQITLESPIPSGEQITLAFASVRLHELSPVPSKIEQNGNQYLQFSTSKKIPSFYKTTKEKTKFKFPNTDIADFTEGAERQGTVLAYGPYESLSFDLADTVTVRFEHTAPLSVVTYFERDIEISHWGGNIAFEDRYAVTNNAAHLRGQFDRVAFAQSAYYNPQSSAIKNLILPLSVGSRDAYFTDEIGNVSTSKFRTSLREANLDIKPRYPIFGGWNYTFTVGWNNDLSSSLRTDGIRHYLRVPFIEGSDDVTYEDLRVRVILPEGAENVRVHSQVPTIAVRHGVHKTFMDTIGRTVVMLEAENLVDERARQDMFIEYDYRTTAAYRKPFVVIAAIGVIFTASSILSKVW